MDYNSLVKQYPGYQGWGQTEALADFAATGGSGKGGSKSGGSSSGGSADFDMSKIPSVLDFTEKAYSGADEALKQYVLYLRGQRQPLDVYKEFEEAVGLPAQIKVAGTIREQIASLEDTIRRTEKNIADTTKESYITEGQRAGMVEARRKPLIENLSTLSTNLGRLEQGISSTKSDIGMKTGLFMEGQAQQAKPFEVQLTALQDRAARLVSSFSIDAQNQLDVLTAKWQRQNALDDREWQQAYDLLKMEKDYQKQVDYLREQSKVDLADYESKKKIDQRYKTSDSVSTPIPTSSISNSGGSDWSLQSPPMSAQPGTTVEYPSGSGIYWTMGANGKWE